MAGGGDCDATKKILLVGGLGWGGDKTVEMQCTVTDADEEAERPRLR